MLKNELLHIRFNQTHAKAKEGYASDSSTHSEELFLWLCIGEMQGGRSWQSLSNRSFFLPLTDGSL